MFYSTIFLTTVVKNVLPLSIHSLHIASYKVIWNTHLQNATNHSQVLFIEFQLMATSVD